MHDAFNSDTGWIGDTLQSRVVQYFWNQEVCGGIQEFQGHRCKPGYVFDENDQCIKEEPLEDVDEQKELGKPDCTTPSAGNPCNPISGNKFQTETDYTGTGPFPLRFERFYNSERSGAISPGADWQHTYQRTVKADPVTGDGAVADVARADGQILTFTFSAGIWSPDPDVRLRLDELIDPASNRTGWLLIDENDAMEQYDAAGRLVRVTNREGFSQALAYDENGNLHTVTGPFGRTLALTHDASGRVSTLTDPAGTVYRYDYDAAGNLATVTYPDDTPANPADNPTRVYHYENVTFPFHLTGITDENGSRFAAWTYDDEGRATSSERAGGANRIDISYNEDGTSTVTDALGNATVYSVENIFGVRKTTGLDQPCPLCLNKSASNTYDENGYLASSTDFNGNVTTFVFDERGLELSRTEADGTPDARTVTTEWHPVLRRPITITEPGRVTTMTYDTVGRILTRTVTDSATGDSRTTTRTYDGAGLLASIDGPRTDVADVTTFEYDASGNLVQSVNALSHETQITAYDLHGRPLTIVHASGAVTKLRYDARSRLISREVAGSLTRFDYDGVGNVVRITLPDLSFITQEYDGANRLIGMTENLGNRVTFVLDALGNRVSENTFDPNGALTRTRSRVYNVLNRLVTDIGGVGQTTDFSYDPQGNVIATVDPNNQWTTSAYDALNRLIETVAPDDGTTEFEYDARDNLVSVTDPRGLETVFNYNGFDEVTATSSPDTGLTTQTYDQAGNRISRTDARGIIATFEYDALNRLVSIRYPSPSENVTFRYDEGTNGIGRLTTILDESGETRMTYDVRGNLIEETRIIGNVALATTYAYDEADRLVAMDYSGGLRVNYGRDALGRIVSVDTIFDGAQTSVVSNMVYAPFGPVIGWTYGNGIVFERGLDKDYRLLSQRALPVQDLGFGYDPAGNILSMVDGTDTSRDQAFAYDPVNRLAAADGVYGDRGYAYDRVGNRVSREANGATESYLYAGAANQLLSVNGAGQQSFTYDAVGNTIIKGPLGFGYNQANRMASATASGQPIASYLYNAKGERVKKTVDGESLLFHYDAQGNLLGEYESDESLLRAYVYADGERLAMVIPKRPDYVFDGENRRTGAEISVAVFMDEQTIEIEGGLGLTGQYVLSGKEWKLDEDGNLKLSFQGTDKRFEANLDLVTLEGSLTGKSAGPAHPFKLTGRDLDPPFSGVFYYHNDHLGTSKANTDGNRNLVWQSDHTPFGTALVSVNVVENNQRFPGQYFDAETGLHYNYFRDYDSEIGKYIQTDPVGLSGGLNQYEYARSNSLLRSDRLGLFSFEGVIEEMENDMTFVRDPQTSAIIGIVSASRIDKCRQQVFQDCIGDCLSSFIQSELIGAPIEHVALKMTENIPKESAKLAARALLKNIFRVSTVFGVADFERCTTQCEIEPTVVNPPQCEPACFLGN